MLSELTIAYIRRQVWLAKLQANEIGRMLSGNGQPKEPEQPTGKYARVPAGSLLKEMGVKIR